MTYTTEEKKAIRNAKKQESIKFNEDIIKDLGITKNEFNVKTTYTHNGEKVFLVFGWEFEKKNGYYFELIDENYNFTSTRDIYTIPYTEDYDEKYEVYNDKSDAYAVPVKSVKKITRASIAISKVKALGTKIKESVDFDFDNIANDTSNSKGGVDLVDCSFKDMTIRDLIAILHKAPISNKNWLNAIISNL